MPVENLSEYGRETKHLSPQVINNVQIELYKLLRLSDNQNALINFIALYSGQIRRYLEDVEKIRAEAESGKYKEAAQSLLAHNPEYEAAAQDILKKDKPIAA